jgi:ubiquitin-protein ligase
LRSDWKALQQLAAESSICRFQAEGNPPDEYEVTFQGRGVGQNEKGEVYVREEHDVLIRLGANYPRVMPELRWMTEIFHPNISANGSVCLGGYQKHWVPSLDLAELCEMLWDMIRYENYDVRSAFNRMAAEWSVRQERFDFPLDNRPIRDKLAVAKAKEPVRQAQARPKQPDVVFAEVVEEAVTAQIVDERAEEILYIS